MVYLYYYNTQGTLYSAFFFSFRTTIRHSNNVVPLIATHINDKALIMILKTIKNVM